MKAQIVNFGCKLNQYEGESLKEALIENGIEAKIVHPSKLYHLDGEKTIYIINTCTVTSKSDRKARNAIYKAATIKKDKDLLIITGCYAQTDREELAKIKGVDLVIGNFEKSLIPQIVIGNDEIYNDVKEKSKLVFKFRDPIRLDRSRAYVKVQDGCDMHCSYCKIPLARGRSMSRPAEDVISYIKKIEDYGYHEAVLTGINLGSYKYNGITLTKLLEIIIDSTHSIGIRLSSIEPMYFKSGLFDILSSDRIMPHFHVPMQSGSDKILKLMRRPYNIQSFIDIVDKLRKIRESPHIATDVIAGFPSEKREDFEDSYMVIKNLEFSSIHVFTYSPRRGTEALKIKDDVSFEEKAERSHRLIELGRSLNYQFRLKFLNKCREAIFEKHGNKWIGVTDNYIKVTLVNGEEQSMSKKKLPILITRVTPSETSGKLVGLE